MTRSPNNYNYDLYYKRPIFSRSNKKRFPDPSFLDWFVDFIQREANFNCSISEYRKNPDYSTVEYSLSFQNKNRHVLDSIRTQLGFGLLYAENGYYHLVFQRKDRVSDILTIFYDKITLSPERAEEYEIWFYGICGMNAEPLKLDDLLLILILIRNVSLFFGFAFLNYLLWQKNRNLFIFVSVSAFFWVWFYRKSPDLSRYRKARYLLSENRPTVKTAAGTDKIKPEHTVKTCQLLDSKKEKMSDQSQKGVLETAKNCSVESESKLTPSVEQDVEYSAATIEYLMATDLDVINRIGDHCIRVRLIPVGINYNCLHPFKKKLF